eukprot:gene8811-biopygen16665
MVFKLYTLGTVQIRDSVDPGSRHGCRSYSLRSQEPGALVRAEVFPEPLAQGGPGAGGKAALTGEAGAADRQGVPAPPPHAHAKQHGAARSNPEWHGAARSSTE